MEFFRILWGKSNEIPYFEIHSQGYECVLMLHVDNVRGMDSADFLWNA